MTMSLTISYNFMSPEFLALCYVTTFIFLLSGKDKLVYKNIACISLALTEDIVNFTFQYF